MTPSHDNKTIAITSYGHGLCHMAELAFAAVIPAVMSEYSLPADQAVALGIPGLMMFGLAAPIAGFWADRRGYREALLGYYLLVALAAVFIIFCSPSAWLLMAGLTFLGVAISIYHPVGMAMLANCQNRGRAMGINGVAGSVGIAIGPAFAIFVGSWRLTYALIAACASIGFVATLFVQSGRRPSAKPVEPAKATSHAKSELPIRTAVILLTMLFAAVAIGGFNYRSLMTALPSYLNDSGNVSATDYAFAGSHKSAVVVFIVLAMGGFGQMLGGYLADRFSVPKLYVSTILISAPFAYCLSQSSAQAGAWFAAGLAVFMFAQQPLENTMIAVVTPAKWRSTIYGLKFILAFGVASSGMYVAGFIWENYGINRVFAFFAAMAIVMAGLALLLAWGFRNAQNGGSPVGK